MSNSDVFGSPMILRGRTAASPFGAAPYTRSRATAPIRIGRWLMRQLKDLFARSDEARRIRQTVIELSRLEDHMLRDIGLNRSAIISAAHEAERQRRWSARRQRR